MIIANNLFIYLKSQNTDCISMYSHVRVFLGLFALRYLLLLNPNWVRKPKNKNDLTAYNFDHTLPGLSVYHASKERGLDSD